MNGLENLVQEAHNEKVDIINYQFNSDKIKGLYCNGTIALNKNIQTETEKSCVLAEELGHYYTTVGNILDQSKVENRKQEQKARAWAYDKLVNLQGIIKVYESGYDSLHEAAEYLEVTEDFLREALTYYRSKYGVSVKSGDCIIFFEPSLGVLKLI